MKVLYIAPYRNGDEYTDASVNYMLALDRIGVDVVARNILNQNIDTPEPIKKLENKPCLGCDKLIIHSNPEHMEYHGGFDKILGITAIETNDLTYTSYGNHLRNVDTVVVANEYAKKSCVGAGLKNVVKLPYAFDTQIFNTGYEPIPELKRVLKNDYTFYVIGRHIRRKNLIDILRAFYTEFRPDEPVNIVLKIGGPDMPPEIVKKEIETGIQNVKMGIRLYPDISHYKREIIITDYMKQNELFSLHNTCDCFINCGVNENWCYSAFIALGFGKQVISIDYAGPNEYLNNKNAYIVKAIPEPCAGFSGKSDAYTGYETWVRPDILSLRKQMRQAYMDRNTYLSNSMAAEALNSIDRYSYENLGQQLQVLLNGKTLSSQQEEEKRSS